MITASDVASVYECPLVFAEQGVDEIALRLLSIQAGPRNLARWGDMVRRMKEPARQVTIGLVGKYVEYEDSYKSLKEALLHGGLAHDTKVDITWIEIGAFEMAGGGRRTGSTSMESWCPADSDAAVSKACCNAIRYRARRTGFLTSVFAWECRPW